MTPETLKIDLRNPTTEGLGELTEDQKKALATIAEQRKAAGQSETIEIAKEEIDKLRASLDNPAKLKEILWVKEFIWTSSADILTGSELEKNFWGKEKFESYTKLSEEILFSYLFKGKDALLGDLNVSEKAKKSLVVWFNFFLFDALYNLRSTLKLGDTLSIFTNHIKELLTGNYEPLVEELKKGSPLIDSKQVKGIFWGLTGNLQILRGKFNGKQFKNSGENNTIFMNPRKWFDFFKWISDGSIKENDIALEIEKNETDSPVTMTQQDKDELKNIGDKWKEIIWPITWKALGAVSGFRDIIKNYKDSIVSNIPSNFISILAQLEEIPFIWGFLKWLAEALGIKSWSNLLDERNFDEFKTSFSWLLKADGLIFSKLKAWSDFLVKNGEKDISFMKNLSALKWNSQQSNDDYFKEMFKKDGEFAQFYELAKGANVGIWDISRPGDELNYTSLSLALDIFRQYKEAKNARSWLTIETFLQERKTTTEQAKKQIQQIMDSKESIGWPESVNVSDDKLESTVEVWGKWYKITLIFATKDVIVQSGGESFHFQIQGQIKVEGKELIELIKTYKEAINKWTVLITKSPQVEVLKNIKEILTGATNTGKIERKSFTYRDSEGEKVFQYIPNEWETTIPQAAPTVLDDWTPKAANTPAETIKAGWTDIGWGFKKLNGDSNEYIKIANDTNKGPYLEIHIGKDKKLSKIEFWWSTYQLTWWWSQSFSSYPDCSLETNNILNVGWEKIALVDVYKKLKDVPEKSQKVSLSPTWDIKKV